MILNFEKYQFYSIIYNIMNLKYSNKIKINIKYIILIYLFIKIIEYKKREFGNTNKIYNIKIENNSFKFYYFNFSKDLNYLHIYQKECKFIDFINKTYLNTIKKEGKKIKYLLLDADKNIDNLFILTLIYPFIKKNCTIIYKIKNRNIYKYLNNTFTIKRKKIYQIKLKDLKKKIFDKYNESIYYKWEKIYETNLINNLRYVINNYYNDSFLEIFDKSLNLNFKNKIQNIKNLISSDIINELMSKFLINIIIIRKFRNL